MKSTERIYAMKILNKWEMLKRAEVCVGCILSKNGVCEKGLVALAFAAWDAWGIFHMQMKPFVGSHVVQIFCVPSSRVVDTKDQVKGQGWKELLAISTHFPLFPESPHPDSGLSSAFSPLSLALPSLLSVKLSSSWPYSIQHAHSSSFLTLPDSLGSPLCKSHLWSSLVLLWCPFPLSDVAPHVRPYCLCCSKVHVGWLSCHHFFLSPGSPMTALATCIPSLGVVHSDFLPFSQCVFCSYVFVSVCLLLLW